MTRYTRYIKNSNKNKRNYTVKYKSRLIKGGDGPITISYYDFYNVNDTTEATNNKPITINSIDSFFQEEEYPTEETCDYDESYTIGGEPESEVNRTYPEKKNVVDIKTYKYENLPDIPQFRPTQLFKHKNFNIKSYRYNTLV